MFLNVHRDFRRRVDFLKFEKKKIIAGCLGNKCFKLLKLNTRRLPVHRTKIQNVDIWTGRTRSVQNYFRCSRFFFKGITPFGLIPGLKSAAW